ncbi:MULTISPECIES: LptA/OstA family protein [unclassified Meridianimarinicoccus]|uniref:LptA/OstA family protein n=1 Tax=unclassified Meridianimarinicoccus TaxID=2923344 RepID=UPI001868716F|nr:LptA/OstA family protein [Fluviibacterium sp. MJW13]
MRRHFRIILGLVALCLAQPVAAQTSVATGGFRNADPDAPVEVTSDQLDLTRDAGTALFTGNVVAVQGDMRLSAQWVLVEYVVLEDGSLGSDIKTITARDDVLLVTPEEAAEGDEAIYTPLSNEVVMTGNVLLTQGANTVAGERLVVDLETGIGQVAGRVRTILQPQDEQP